MSGVHLHKRTRIFLWVSRQWPTRLLLGCCLLGLIMVFYSKDFSFTSFYLDTNSQRKLQETVNGTPYSNMAGLTSTEISNKSEDAYPQTAISRENDTAICSIHDRYRHLRDKCKTRSAEQTSKVKFKSVFVDDEYKLIFCQLPKIGSTSLKYFLGELHETGDSSEEEDDVATRGRHRFIETPPDKREHLLQNYFKFIIVRHPLERLPSCWLNRVQKYHYPIVRLLERFQPSVQPTADDRGAPSDVTFDEFVTLLVEHYHQGFKNPHWETYDKLCGLCDIPYDHIFRLETLDWDIQALFTHLRSLNSSLQLNFSQRNVMDRKPTFDKMRQMKKWFTDVSPLTVERLIQIYKDDMELFGYQWDSELGATCELQSSEGNSCC